MEDNISPFSALGAVISILVTDTVWQDSGPGELRLTGLPKGQTSEQSAIVRHPSVPPLRDRAHHGPHEKPSQEAMPNLRKHERHSSPRAENSAIRCEHLDSLPAAFVQFRRHRGRGGKLIRQGNEQPAAVSLGHPVDTGAAELTISVPEEPMPHII